MRAPFLLPDSTPLNANKREKAKESLTHRFNNRFLRNLTIEKVVKRWTCSCESQMTPSEYLLAQALRTCKMDLSGNGRRKLLPPELNHGVLFSFNGHQSIGDYMASLDELLNAVKLDLMETRGKWSIEVALELADLDSTLKHRSKAVLHERLFTGNWRIVEREPEVLEQVKAKVTLFFDAQTGAFQRWKAMRDGVGGLIAAGIVAPDYFKSAEDSAELGFQWKGTTTDAVELALALDASGFLLFSPQTTQQERIKELVQKLGESVPHLDQTLNQLMNRKAGPVKAIDRLRGALLARQEVRDRG